MKVTVELSDSEMKEACRVTGQRKKGPAIRKLVVDALISKRRAALAAKFISGQYGVELKGLEAGTRGDQKRDEGHAARWRL